MSHKQFRIRDVVISLPVDAEPGGPAMCAEAPSVPGCLDLESIIPECPDITHLCGEIPTVILCWPGGATIIECGGQSICGWFATEVPCEIGSPSICEERISPLVKLPDCDDAITWLDCGPASRTPIPFIDGVNTPVIFERLAGTGDLPALKQELRHILEVIEQYDLPSAPEELDAVEERLNRALADLRARRRAAEGGE